MASTSAGPGRAVKTSSDPAARARGVCAQTAPLAMAGAADSGLLVSTSNLWPAAKRCPAIGPPMAPSPTKPILIVCLQRRLPASLNEQPGIVAKLHSPAPAFRAEPYGNAGAVLLRLGRCHVEIRLLRKGYQFQMSGGASPWVALPQAEPTYPRRGSPPR